MTEYIEKAMMPEEYIELIDTLLADGKTTGPDQSEAMLNYGKLNRQRMKRLDKTVKLNDSLTKAANSFNRKMIWLIITEGWCGDAAQNLPVVEKIAEQSPKIETRYILRDENLDLMDQHLTNGARSIPVLIALDAETFKELGTWGPRPTAAMSYRKELLERGLEKGEISEKIQRWYLADKERMIQREFETLLKKWGSTYGTQSATPAFVETNNLIKGSV